MNKPLKSHPKEVKRVRSMLTTCPDLHYQLKVHSILTGKKIYDLTDQAIREFLEKDNASHL